MNSLEEPLQPSDNGTRQEAGDKARVLLVEDDPQVQRFVTSQLLRLGYQVAAVSSALDALNLLKGDGEFDLLFSDVVLVGGMSGIELARIVRGKKPDQRILLTSGYPEEVFEHYGRPAGDILLLRKPYRKGELASTLRTVLSRI